jgi:sulfatase maturation enzyme AslB (radical SAM superfamily)
MWGMKKYYLGNIDKANPLALQKVLVNDAPCVKCDIHGVCGGRCLYAIITKRWSQEEYATLCGTVKGLVRTVEQQVPRIKQLIETGRVKPGDFNYYKYNGCEIIP